MINYKQPTHCFYQSLLKLYIVFIRKSHVIDVVLRTIFNSVEIIYFVFIIITLFENSPKNKMKKYVKQYNLHINDIVTLSSNDC